PSAPVAPPVPPVASEQPTVRLPQTAPVAGAPVPPPVPAPQPAPVAGAPVPPQGPGAPVPPYQQQPGAQVPAPQAPMNPLALVSFIGSFFVGLVGVICGHIALKQIKRDGSRGRGFALAGTIIGYVSVATGIIATIVIIVTLVTGAAIVGTAASEAQKQYEDSQTSIAPTETTESTPSESSDGTKASSAFCTALDKVEKESLNIDPSAGAAPQALIDAYKELASAATGDHKAIYQQMADLLANPANVDTSKVSELQSELTSAVASDYVDCM
ncbi:DUF4190 domain-containing protein, partial [Leucobacter sp. OAMSW11]|uniref:DUF4190 domain-containing protein n=3 Tax=Leucobacter TaxID=55968 RepID=UPI001AEF8FAC